MTTSRRIIVQKYGGSSVATPEKLRQVARLVAARRRGGFDLVVVVSAMGDATDELLARAKAITAEPDHRELDMLLSVGERISMSLLAMAIRAEGLDAVSLTGSQSGILTSASHTAARIMEVRPFRIQDELEAGRVVIVAGYQGVSYKREITTLGRGGSDTTAVALAAALDAEACEIYSDVPGVFTADPRVVPDARRLDALGYEEMQELAESGAKVLNAQAVEFAKQRGIAIYARKTGAPDEGTVVRRDAPAPPARVRGIAHERHLAAIEAHGVELPRATLLLERLDALGAAARQVTFAGAGTAGTFACVVGLEDVHHERRLEDAVVGTLGAGSIRFDRGAVSLVGVGINQDARVLRQALGALRDRGAAVHGVSTSSFRISLLVDATAVEAAVRTLHEATAPGDPPRDAGAAEDPRLASGA
jgi:aspartate kinase